MLEAQRTYGSDSARSDDNAISIGRNLYATLPEDAFDRRPFERGSLRLVADVRLDNRSELAACLGISLERLARMSDSELLFEGLLAWGDTAPQKLVGEFAFALWNSEDQSLLLGRDILGHRPLYFHRAANFFAFSSMPSGLHALAEVPRGFDAEFIAEALALLPHTGSKTYFRHVERVEPAHTLRVTRNGAVRSKYWEPPQPAQGRQRSADYVEGLRTIFDDAVEAQLRGAGEAVGCHLSGGLDSSIVTSTAARLMAPNKVIALTAAPRKGFDGPVPRGVIADETELASETVQRYPNIEHILVESSAESPLAALDREHFYQQQPIANLCNAVWGRGINRIANSRGLKVLLVGNYGNMTISYSGLEYLPWLIARGRVFTALRMARSLASNGVPWRSLRAQLIGPFLPAPLWNLACRLHGRPTDLNAYSAVMPELRRSLEYKARERRHDLLYRPSSDPLQLRLSVLSDGDGGNYFKGVLAEWGLSMRDPTADKRVLEYCLSVPAEEYVRGGLTRSLARRTFADRLPSRVVGSPIRGYQSPDWYEAVERDFPALLEEAAAIERCGSASAALDIEWLKEAVATWPKGGWASQEVMMRYRYGLLRAVSAGHFMRKVEGTN